jgi:hypothetical protein
LEIAPGHVKTRRLAGLGALGFVLFFFRRGPEFSPVADAVKQVDQPDGEDEGDQQGAKPVLDGQKQLERADGDKQDAHADVGFRLVLFPPDSFGPAGSVTVGEEENGGDDHDNEKNKGNHMYPPIVFKTSSESGNSVQTGMCVKNG